MFFDFRYLGKRCRERTTLANTPANRKNCRSFSIELRPRSPLAPWIARVFPLRESGSGNQQA
ncbi:Arm DNA-binding domain-containing protein [Stutzerimonas stutzeri]|uniref:Arm DNA-binding domain-containing protein n=1 Tax=Stutzerimonas stutzeri TaxID=316 RepID=UPI0039B6F6A2